MEDPNEEIIAELREQIGDQLHEIEELKTALEAAHERRRGRERDLEGIAARNRRLRNALEAAGVNPELIAAIEWDR